MSVVIPPGKAAEIKLRMKKGAMAVYSWKIEGGPVYFHTHGDGLKRERRSYGKGTAVGGIDGLLEAAFDGDHGWFWRNNSRQKITVTLKTKGDYAALKRVL